MHNQTLVVTGTNDAAAVEFDVKDVTGVAGFELSQHFA